MSRIQDFNFAGQVAVVRVDFNVPFNEEDRITDDTRMRAALPTLEKILSDGGTAVVLSHLGRPKKADPALSLRKIAPHLAELTGRAVHFSEAPIGPAAQEFVTSLPQGSLILLENIRFYEEEEGKLRNADAYTTEEELKQAKADLKTRQKAFAAQLAALGNVYVNDAFGTAHRAHASTALIADSFPKDRRLFGFLMEKEVQAVEQVLTKAQKPFTAIVGGAKVSSKIDIIKNLLDRVQNLVIVGGMAYTFVKAQGGSVGKSLVEDDKLEVAREILQAARDKGVNLLLPAHTVATQAFEADAPAQNFPTDRIPEGWMGMDVSAQGLVPILEALKSSKTILWNGPAGVFEFDRFAQGSLEIARAVAQATQAGAYSLVGGGDSVACIHKLGLEDQISYVSTGGGALLEAIEGKTLPGVAAIQN